MTRWINEETKPDLPDTTLSNDAFKAPKLTMQAGFSGGSVTIQNGTSKSLVSSTNGYGYSNGVCDGFEEGVDTPVLSIVEAEPEQYGNHKNRDVEMNGDVSSSDGWENESNNVTKTYLKDPLQSKSINEAIPLPAPPLYSGQANGGNSSYLLKPDAVVPSLNSASFSSNWISSSPSRSPGDVGLTNLGNTCFLNSGLQCLLHSGGLVEYFLTCKFKESIGSGMFSLLRSFQIVIQQVWSAQFDCIPLNDFRNILGGIHPQFKDGRQHDCQEFLGFTLDTLHEQLKKWHLEEPGKTTNSTCNESAVAVVAPISSVKQEGEDVKDEIEMATQSDDNQVDIDGSFDSCEEVTSSMSPTSTPTLKSQTSIRSHARLGSTKAGRKPSSSLHTARKLFTSPNKILQKVKQTSLKKTMGTEVSTNGSFEGLVAEKISRKKPQTEPNSDEETSTKKIKVDEGEDLNHDNSQDTNENGKKAEDAAEIKHENVTRSVDDLRGKAGEYWNKHMDENNTVITSTFQGLYKSTVICSECTYVSITYEPFMYLSLPIPRVTTKELKIKVKDMKDPDSETTDVVLTLELTDNIAKLKEAIIDDLRKRDLLKDPENAKASDYWISEVVNYYVSRYLEDNTLIRDINDSCTNIFAYELNNNFNSESTELNLSYEPESAYATFYAGCESQPRELIGRSYLGDEEDWDADTTPVPPLVEVHEGSFSDNKYSSSFVPSSSTTSQDTDEKSTQTTEPVLTNVDDKTQINGGYGRWDETCCICLESDSNLDFRRHNFCGCVVCKDCVKRGAEHYDNEKKKENPSEPCGLNFLKCPICMRVVEHVKEFVPHKPTLDPFLRMQLITILFRCDSDTNNNSASSRLIGIPFIVRLPSCLPTSQFNEFIARMNLFPASAYKVVIVDNKGTRCAHCVYTDECHGCEISIREREDNIQLSAISTLAICYSNLSEEDISEVEPIDMMKGTPPTQLYSPAPWLNHNKEPQVDIYDCLTIFSANESLDEQNGWFCPTCKKHQRATKSMSVCKIPDYLIVYLKRFVFVDNASIKLNNKLSFPLAGLDLKPYIAEESVENECVYDLYACVCHYGSASAGHYTAFGKNPVSQKWSYFNDSQVTTSTPGEPDFSSAYVLFYQRKGVTYNIPAPETIKILPMHNPLQVACVVPYQNLYGSSSYLKSSSCPSQAVQACVDDGTIEVGLSATSSNSDRPHMNACDSSKRLKSRDSFLTNGHLEDEDQENHCPPKMVNGYDSGESDSEKKTFNLSRKTRRTVRNFSGGGDTAMDG